MPKDSLKQRAKLVSILKKYTNAIKIDNKELSKDVLRLAILKTKKQF